MDQERIGIPENEHEEDKSLSVAVNLYKNSLLSEKSGASELDAHWFKTLFDVINNVVGKGQISELQAKELTEGRDQLTRDMDSTNAVDADKKNKPTQSQELFDRGKELLLKTIAFTRKDEVLEEAARARFQWKRISDDLTKEIYARQKQFKKIENNKYRWGWFNLVSGVVDFILQDKRGDNAKAQTLYEEKVILLVELNKYLRDAADKERIYDEADPWKRKKIPITPDFLDRGDAILDKSIDILVNNKIEIK
jgi:hypothetical protein